MILKCDRKLGEFDEQGRQGGSFLSLVLHHLPDDLSHAEEKRPVHAIEW